VVRGDRFPEPDSADKNLKFSCFHSSYVGTGPVPYPDGGRATQKCALWWRPRSLRAARMSGCFWRLDTLGNEIWHSDLSPGRRS
jgi:hypothetical protein